MSNASELYGMNIETLSNLRQEIYDSAVISSQQQFKKELIHCRISFLQKCKSSSAEQHYLSTFIAQALGDDVFLEELIEFVECESYSNMQPQYRDRDRCKEPELYGKMPVLYIIMILEVTFSANA